ncbi:MAG: sigma-70 family RNA polymerase sigma factor [Polyangiaceae bacterium]|nr:sigma-70 family RNA polymerase sigma factor [Polyangiaceae bacterium]
MTTSGSSLPPRTKLLGDAALRGRLVRLIRGKVPKGEVEDIVQATLTEALAAEGAPDDPALLSRWVCGIARHKCVDFYRHRSRELPAEDSLAREPAGEGEPHSAREWIQWAEQELPPGEPAERTLEWMLREADGDKLEHIADEEAVPPPRVRQRVTRLRRHFRERWAAQMAALVAAVTLLAIGFALYRQYRRVEAPVGEIAKERPRPEQQRATELRRDALRLCDEDQWQPCLDRLDEAARLDPAGNVGGVVEEARSRAKAGLERVKSAPPSTAPSSSQEDLSSDPDQPSPIPEPSIHDLAPPKANPAPKPTSLHDDDKGQYDGKGELDQKTKPDQRTKPDPPSKQLPVQEKRTNAPNLDDKKAPRSAYPQLPGRTRSQSDWQSAK